MDRLKTWYVCVDLYKCQQIQFSLGAHVSTLKLKKKSSNMKLDHRYEKDFEHLKLYLTAMIIYQLMKITILSEL